MIIGNPEVVEAIMGKRRTDAAVKTLEAKGYKWNGGEFWKPSLVETPDFNTVDGQRTRINELELLLAEKMEEHRTYRNKTLAAIKKTDKALRKALAVLYEQHELLCDHNGRPSNG